MSETLTGAKGANITVYTIYRVCQDDPLAEAQNGSAPVQQVHHLLQKGFVDPNPRKIFEDDFIRNVSKTIDSGNQVLVMGDFNDPIESAFAWRLHETCNLKDLLLREGKDPIKSMRIPGMVKRINWILGTTIIKHAVQRSGMISDSINSQSDHQCLYVDLCKTFLFSQQASSFQTKALRKLPVESTIRLNTSSNSGKLPTQTSYSSGPRP